MEITATSIQDCYHIQPKLLGDERGFFMESYREEFLRKQINNFRPMVQDNLSQSKYGTVRGLHAQQGVHAQAKLVSAFQGKVLDVVVDMREDSSSYKQVLAVVLDSEKRNQLYVPRGCFHGFSVLSEQAIFFYKCDNYYHGPSEVGLQLADPELNIDWQVPIEDRIISAKDLAQPSLAEYLKNQSK